jgi:hypothetical protein
MASRDQLDGEGGRCADTAAQGLTRSTRLRPAGRAGHPTATSGRVDDLDGTKVPWLGDDQDVRG